MPKSNGAKADLPAAEPKALPMWVTWGGDADHEGRAIAIREAGKGLAESEPVVRSKGSSMFLDVAPGGVGARDGNSRRDYDLMRPGERVPTSPKGVIAASMQCYEEIGIIRNIIDLMADFTVQGIDLQHPNEKIEQWYKSWFCKVNGKDRSERISNMLYRVANVIVRRQTAKLTVAAEDEMKRTSGDADIKLEKPEKVSPREIPWSYTIMNPMSVEVACQELAMFVGSDDFVFEVKVPKTVCAKIKSPKTPSEKVMVAKLSPEIREGIQGGATSVVLPPDKTRAFYYKKDDWKLWATPMLGPILSDLQTLQKMKLTDLAALDGAVSCIRVWKLGSIENKVLPTSAAIRRLAGMLANNVGGGVMDLVWDDTIDLIETSTDVHQFLGNTKYEPVLNAIYGGLGIPQTLTGNTSSGTTNNFISLKTLTERLQYVRDVLIKFWEGEIKIVQKAMGFRFPAKIVFDRMVLSDEAAEKQLLLNMWDRSLISDESIQERFRETPEVEQVRIRREERRRIAEKRTKASPLQVDKQHDLNKLFSQLGMLSPSEAGLETLPKKPGEKSPKEMDQKAAKLAAKQAADNAPALAPGLDNPKKPSGNNGRPTNKKDEKKRKQKRVLPRTKAHAELMAGMGWAENALSAINQHISPVYLGSIGKKTLRELNDEESKNFEEFKFFSLFNLEFGQSVGREEVLAACSAKLELPKAVADLVAETMAIHSVNMGGKEPGFETLRRCYTGAYALWNMSGVEDIVEGDDAEDEYENDLTGE